MCDGKGATTTSSSGRAARDLEAHVATRAHDGHDHEGSPARTIVYFYTQRHDREEVHVYQKLAQPQEGGANPCLFMSSSEYAGAHTNING